MEGGRDGPESLRRVLSEKTSKELLEVPEAPPEEADDLSQETQDQQKEVPVLVAEPVGRKLLGAASAGLLSGRSGSSISLWKAGPPIVIPFSEHAIRIPMPKGQISSELLQSKEARSDSAPSVKERLFAAEREGAKSPALQVDKRGPARAEKLSEARTEARAGKDSPKRGEQEPTQRSSQELVPSKPGSATSREGAAAPALATDKSKLSHGSQGPPSNSDVTSLETMAGTSLKESETSRTQTPASSATLLQEEDSIVSSAFPGMLFEEKTKPLSDHPLSLSWVFGYNNQLPVFNLLDEDQQVILYVSAQVAVIHDLIRNKQYLLQGHSSCISCICASDDRRWIATADRGPESLVIVWDSYSAVPVHTIFDSHPEGGVSAITISHDSKFLATLGAGEVQKVSIWRWTTLDTKPVCSVEILPQFGFQNYIAFSGQTQKELVSNSESQVVFYSWEDGLHYHAPLLTDKTFNKAVGFFSQSRFHFNSAQAISSTSEGKLVIWDVVCSPLKGSTACEKLYNMKAIKLVHLQKDAITVLAITDELFVTCDVRGHVKFYDGDLQLMHWYSQFKLGPIQSISFSKKPASPGDITKYPESCTLDGKPFVVRNFILATLDGLVIHIQSEETKVTKCLEEPKDAVHTIVCHPSKSLLAKGSYCGLLKVWSYTLHKYLVSRIFKGESISSLCYNHDGSLLAAGFLNGSVYILDSISLENDCPEPFQYSKGPVTIMSFSHNSEYLATADENLSLNLYKKMVIEEKKVWDRLAALHSHYKPIRTLLFGVHLDSDEPRLLSLGEDRLLVEYDLESTVKDELVVIRRDRIEQSAVPKYIAWYPPITTEYFFLTANDHYKMKIYNVTTKLCRKTVLGPTYGSPLEKIIILPLAEGHDLQKRYLAYITKDKIGLQILPVDGNPHKSSAFICHPMGVADLACSYSGRYLFTAGGSDLTVMKWDVNLDALDAAVSLGGKDLVPFYNLLEGGRDGEFFKELEDYFYYAQLCHQGINTMEPRKVSTHIPLEQVPFVMRAMGFYPSEEQVEDMLNEVKFSEFLETGKQVTHINLGDFIKLYVNHRPAFGLASKEIQNAFQVLGYENEDHEATINRDDLLLLLQHKGEHFTEEELAEHLTTLLGFNPEGGRSEVGTYDPTGADDLIQEEIPEEITAAQFTKDILGLPIPEPMEVVTETQTSDEPTSSSFLSLKSQ
ncbi:cilia- and flagella-associated protein 251 [Python bivittatus]|uniref:Cilia- and flagella-associated protein 251 n=1 Tax=Python bivittatus TaxID=176946 RepID=A0A9F5IFM6_PYTBI|nr:cilia- and flagella-associated protein 251 [Python bivittatus]